jgi:L-alanine-DL-glutamate epimerase-like enolase superfamily enzyme
MWAYKVKVGVNVRKIDAERTRRVCDVLGPGFLICSDANQGWTVPEGERYVHGVADSLLDFFEQPVRQDDLAGMAKIAAATRVPIAADEGIHSLDHIRAPSRCQGRARRKPQSDQVRRTARCDGSGRRLH